MQHINVLLLSFVT